MHIVILSPAKDLTPLASDKRLLLAARHAVLLLLIDSLYASYSGF
jgi:hypothetical protein